MAIWSLKCLLFQTARIVLHPVRDLELISQQNQHFYIKFKWKRSGNEWPQNAKTDWSWTILRLIIFKKNYLINYRGNSNPGTFVFLGREMQHCHFMMYPHWEKYLIIINNNNNDKTLRVLSLLLRVQNSANPKNGKVERLLLWNKFLAFKILQRSIFIIIESEEFCEE